MAAPNIINVTTIVPHSAAVTPANTSRNALVAAPSAGATHKINQIVASNIDTVAQNATVEGRLADGSTYVAIASTISVPANASLVVVDKSTGLYLLDTSVTGEISTLWCTSSTANKLVFSVSYETLS